MKKVLIEFWEEKLRPILMGLIVIFGIGSTFFTGYKIGKNQKDLIPKQNPYTQILTPQQISVAINESNDLLIITKKTGDYILYSDSVGQLIFKMYCSKIYNESKQENFKNN